MINTIKSEFLNNPLKSFFTLCSIAFSFGTFVYFFSDNFINFHIFLFLDSALGAAYCGFLFTALPAWLGYKGKLKNINILMLCVYFISFCFFAINNRYGFLVMCIFWFLLLVFCIFMQIKTKTYNNIAFMILLILICKINYAFTSNNGWLQILIHLNSACVMMINIRISLTIGRSALDENNHKSYIFLPNKHYKNISVFLLLILCAFTYLAMIYDAYNYLYFCSFGVGFSILARLKEWHYKELLKVHYVVFFYICVLILGISYIIYGFNMFFNDYFAALHIVMISGICCMILLVFNIAGLRHNGLKLKFPKLSYLSFLCIFIAIVLRFYNINHIAIILVGLSFFMQLIFYIKVFYQNKFIKDA